MIRTTYPLSIFRLREFLVSRGWQLLPSAKRYERYQAPSELIDNYTLTIPSDVSFKDTTPFIVNILRNLSELYDVSQDQLIAILERPQRVFSVQLSSNEYDSGTISLVNFEAVIDRLKKMLLDVASFVVSGQQTSKDTPPGAIAYLQECRFLQTEVGSFVAKVSVPSDMNLAQGSLLNDAPPVVADDVNARIGDILNLITERVFSGDSDIYSDHFFSESMDLLCVDALDNIRDLFIKSYADEVNFRFIGSDRTNTYKSGLLTDEKLDHLDSYVRYVREHLVDNIALNVQGRIVELRSNDPLSKKNYVKISSSELGGTMIAVTLDNEQYALANKAHIRGRNVRVTGRARQMKTQIKVIELSDFTEL